MMSSKCTSPFRVSRFLSIFLAHAVHSRFIRTWRRICVSSDWVSYHGTHPWHWILQLNHDDWTKVTPLVPVRVKVSREPPERSVGHRPNVLNVRVILSITVKPDHVHVWAGTLLGGELAHTLFLVNLLDVLLEREGHACVVGDLIDGVGLRHPPVDTVQLDQDARLAKAIPVWNQMLRR